MSQDFRINQKIESAFLEKMTSPIFLQEYLVREKVNHHWEQQQELHQGQLFNASLLCLPSFDQPHQAFEMEYKNYIYLRDVIHPKTPLALCGLGVSGVLHRENWFVLARRSSQVSLFKDHWEFGCSGHLSAECYDQKLQKFSLMKQVRQEASEELGLQHDGFELEAVLGLCQHRGFQHADFFMLLSLKASIEQLMKQFKDFSNSEYSEVRMISRYRFQEFLAEHQSEMVPLAAYWMKQLAAAH